MDKIETIKQLEALKEHCISVQKIDECADFSIGIKAIDEAVRLIENMGKSGV